VKVVKNKTTGRIVYREEPEFKEGYGILNAINLGLGKKEELIEVDATQEEWEAECKLQQEEAGPTLREEVDKLKGEIEKVKEDVEKLKKEKESKTWMA
jgi:hypothetical protein